MQAEDAICFAKKKKRNESRSITSEIKQCLKKKEGKQTEQKEQYQSEITKHTDIRVRKIWYELKRQQRLNMCM